MSRYSAQREIDANLVDYKLKFNPITSHFGAKRPMMGGEDWEKDELRPEIEDFNKLCSKNNPMVNLLHVPGLKEMGFLSRSVYYNYKVLSRRTDHGYPSIYAMKNKILADERLHHAIQKTLFEREEMENLELNVENEKQLEEDLHLRAMEVFNEMIATVSSKALKFCGWLFLTLLRQLTSSVHLHQGQLNVLRALSLRDEPVIYFPLHFSHLDYILLSLLSYHNEIRSPFVASGGNLRVPIFSDVMRRVGGFFIRRRIDNGNNKDYVYRAVLHSYVTELLKQNQSLEIFIEGTRSRSGLPNSPKTGLLSVAVEAIEKGFVSDIVMVPVCVSYEKLLEGSFRNELLGQAKVAESFFSSLVKIARIIFCTYYGHIRVNFGAPRSLKKTLKLLRSSSSCSYPGMTSSISSSRSLYEQVNIGDTQENLHSKNSMSSHSVDAQGHSLSHHHKMIPSSSQSLSFYACNQDNASSREIVTLLGEHIVYSSLKCKVMMSTNIVAFLLLHKWRDGVSMPVLTQSFRHLVSELQTRKIDVGFSGDYSEVVLHAVNLLGSHLVQLECKSISNDKTHEYGRHSLKVPCSFDLRQEDEKSLNSLNEHNSNDSGKESLVVEDEDSSSSNMIKTGQYMKLSESGIFDKESLLTFEEKLSDSSEATTVDDLFSEHSDDLEVKEFRKKSEIVLFFKLCVNIPQIFDMAYYANALTPIFAMESIAALAVGAVTKFRFSTLEKLIGLEEGSIDIEYDELPESIKKPFFRSTLLDKMMELIDFLQIDLILCDVTEDLREVANQTIDSLVMEGCLTSDEFGKSATARHSEAVQELCFNDEECYGEGEQWLRVNLSMSQSLIEKQSILASFVECYVVSASQLLHLMEVGESVTERMFRENILRTLHDRVHSGTALKPESASSDIVRSAIRSFQMNGVIEFNTVNNAKFVMLTDNFNDQESIGSLISRLSQYLL